MKTKAAGLGSVTQTKDGRWWARGPRPARHSLGVHETREEAEAARVAYLDELTRAGAARAPGTTLRAFGSHHLDELELDGDRSMPQRRERWGHILRAPFIEDPLQDITRAVVLAWIKVLKKTRVRRGRGPGAVERTISRTYVRAIVGLLSQLFAAAIDEGIVSENPAAGIRIKGEPRDDDESEVWTYLEPHEQRTILTCDVPETDRLTIAFAIGTGLRLGEQTNLELRDLVVDGPRPHIVVRWGSKGRKPKNGKIRTVPLFGLGLDAAKRWLEILPTFAPKNPHRLVFPTKTGARRAPSQHLQQGAGNRVNGFRRALAAAGIERRVRWHDLRHTCASSLIAGWWGPSWRLEEVREQLGHTSTRITERYAHLAPAVVADLAARTPGLLLGDGAAVPLLAMHGNSRSDRTSEEPDSRGSCWAAVPGVISRASDARHPDVTRDLAIAGLRALARGDEATARALALELVLGGEPTNARLCALFEAALVAPNAKASGGR